MTKFADQQPQGHLDDGSRPHVLVVDDDAECLDEYQETLEEFGLVGRSTLAAEEVFDILIADARIGIVITDIRMPRMTGIELIRTLRERLPADRYIVPIVITGFADMELAIAAMRLDAVDFLRKPISRSEFSTALQRAEAIWKAHQQSRKIDDLAHLGQEVSRLISHLQQVQSTATTNTVALDDAKVKRFVQTTITSRQKRAEFLPGEMLSDPVWDILLDLTVAYIDDRPLPVSSACIASGAPISTALRRIRDLTDAGLVIRWQDPQDARRDMVSLSKDCMAKMRDYISVVYRDFESS